MKSAMKSSFKQAGTATDIAYENLANAVIEQAINDYVSCASALYRELMKPPKLQVRYMIHRQLGELCSIETFFHSGAYDLYTKLPASLMYEAIEQRLNRLITPDGCRYIRREINEYMRDPQEYLKQYRINPDTRCSKRLGRPRKKKQEECSA